MDTSDLPADIVKIAEFLARNAKMSGGDLAWQEVAKIKSSIVNEPRRWIRPRVTADAFKAQCRAAGLTAADAAEVSELLRKSHAGKRLVRKPQYRDFRFAIPFDPVE